MEIEINVGLHFIVHVFQHDIVDISTEVTHRCIEQLQLVLHAELFEFCARSREHPCRLSAMADVNLIDVVHQINRLFASDVLIQRAAEIIRNIVFSIGESACSAKSAHDRTGRTFDTGFHLLAVNRTTALLQRITRLKNRYLKLRTLFHQLIRRKNAARTCADDNDIIFHTYILHFSSCG